MRCKERARRLWTGMVVSEGVEVEQMGGEKWSMSGVGERKGGCKRTH